MNTENLKKLALAATPGPWYLNSNDIDDYDDRFSWVSCEDHLMFARIVRRMNGENKSPQCEANASYIAAANPAAILKLIAERNELLAAFIQLNDSYKKLLKSDYNKDFNMDTDIADSFINKFKAGEA